MNYRSVAGRRAASTRATTLGCPVEAREDLLDLPVANLSGDKTCHLALNVRFLYKFSHLASFVVEFPTLAGSVAIEQPSNKVKDLGGGGDELIFLITTMADPRAAGLVGDASRPIP